MTPFLLFEYIVAVFGGIGVGGLLACLFAIGFLFVRGIIVTARRG